MMQDDGGTDFEMEVQNAGKLGRKCGFSRLESSTNLDSLLAKYPTPTQHNIAQRRGIISLSFKIVVK